MDINKDLGSINSQRSELNWFQNMEKKYKIFPFSTEPDAIKLKSNLPILGKNSGAPANPVPINYAEILKNLAQSAPSDLEAQKASLRTSLISLQKAPLASEASILLGTLRDFLSIAKTTGEKCGKKHLPLIVREFNLRKKALKQLANGSNSNESPIFATPELNSLFNPQKQVKPMQVRSYDDREKLVGKIMIDHLNDQGKLTQLRIKEIALEKYNTRISEKMISKTNAYRSMFQKCTDSDCLTDEF